MIILHQYDPIKEEVKLYKSNNFFDYLCKESNKNLLIIKKLFERATEIMRILDNWHKITIICVNKLNH